MDNYWIRANPSFTVTNGQGFAGAINSAVLRYVGAPESDPTTSQTPSVMPLNESDLHPLLSPAAVSVAFLPFHSNVMPWLTDCISPGNLTLEGRM